MKKSIVSILMVAAIFAALGSAFADNPTKEIITREGNDVVVRLMMPEILRLKDVPKELSDEDAVRLARGEKKEITLEGTERSIGFGFSFPMIWSERTTTDRAIIYQDGQWEVKKQARPPVIIKDWETTSFNFLLPIMGLLGLGLFFRPKYFLLTLLGTLATILTLALTRPGMPFLPWAGYALAALIYGLVLLCGATLSCASSDSKQITLALLLIAVGTPLVFITNTDMTPDCAKSAILFYFCLFSLAGSIGLILSFLKARLINKKIKPAQA